jgi:uncharacterized protein YndB with AHSA1/START domain
MDAGHCELRLTRRFDATPAEVWAALTEPDSIGRWLGRTAAIDLSAGGAFALASGVDARVREVEPERVLELDWRFAGEAPSVVRFELAAEGDGTLLMLDHRRIDERFGMAYVSRWTSALARFAREVVR